MTGIEYLMSLPDECCFRWHGISWLVNHHEGDAWFRADRDSFCIDIRTKSLNVMFYQAGLKRIGFDSTPALIATASPETVTVLWPVQEKVCEWHYEDDDYSNDDEYGKNVLTDCGVHATENNLDGTGKFCQFCSRPVRIVMKKKEPEIVYVEVEWNFDRWSVKDGAFYSTDHYTLIGWADEPDGPIFSESFTIRDHEGLKWATATKEQFEKGERFTEWAKFAVLRREG